MYAVHMCINKSIHTHLYFYQKICNRRKMLKIVMLAIAFSLANIFTPKILCNLNLFAFHFAKYTTQHVKRNLVYALFKFVF